MTHSDEQIIQQLHRILRSSDLTKMTRKEVRLRLEEDLGTSLSDSEWKDRIRLEISNYVNSPQKSTSENENENANDKNDKNNKKNKNTNNNHSSNNHNDNNTHNVNDDDDNDNDNDFSFIDDGFSDQEAKHPPANKKRKVNNGTAASSNSNDEYSKPVNNNPNNNNNTDTNTNTKGKSMLLGNRQLIKQSTKDQSSYIQIPGGSKRLVMHKFRGKLYIGLREYFEKDGEELPTKKGCNLNIEQWQFLMNHLNEINAQIEKLKQSK